MYGVLLLTRPFGSVVLGGAVIVGISASGGDCSFSGYLMGFLLGFLLSAGTKCVNDYFDREIDAINVPSRPIQSGLVTPAYALMEGAVLTTIGIVVSVLMNWLVFFIALVSIGLMSYYNWLGKRTGFLGNIIVSLCVTLTIVTGGAITSSFSRQLIFLSGMAFLTMIGLEVTKGIPDVDGDRRGNVRTLAVSHGPQNAARVAVAFFLASVAIRLIAVAYLIVTPGAPGSIWLSTVFVGLPFGFIIGLLTALGLLYSSMMLLRDASPGTAQRVDLYILAWSALGFTAYSIARIM